MERIRTVLVDDEVSNRLVLTSLLKRYCPIIEIVGEATSAVEGVEVIRELKPELVFLDVKMPVHTGFDMLRMFEEIPFRVVFITAHDEFAIQAFEFNAIDYLLKPVDYTKLVKAVDKVALNIQQNQSTDSVQFVKSLDEKSQRLKSISFHGKDKVTLVNIDKISFIQADRNYCDVITDTNDRYVSTKTLAEYENMLKQYANFLRINKSVIINIDYIREYSKGAVCFIHMLHGETEMEVSRRKKSEILQYIKQHQSNTQE